MTSPAASIPCPGCGAPVAIPPSGTSFPFCSPRCRMADLGRWLDGSYALDPETGKLDVIDPDTAEEVVLDDDYSPPRTH